MSEKKVLSQQLKRGEKMEPKVEDYTDSTCVASTGGGGAAFMA